MDFIRKLLVLFVIFGPWPLAFVLSPPVQLCFPFKLCIESVVILSLAFICQGLSSHIIPFYNLLLSVDIIIGVQLRTPSRHEKHHNPRSPIIVPYSTLFPILPLSSMSTRHERQWWPIPSRNTSSVGGPPHKHDMDLTTTSNSHSFNNPSDKPRKQSVGLMKLSTITSAIGFKSKKHPTLAIQEPPPDIRPKVARVDTQTVTRYPNRPPAKSVSTVQSWDDPSSEPQTPLDLVKGDMPKVSTTSDPYQFCSRGIRSSPVIQDPNRLSVYSGSSISDTLSKKNESAIAFKRLSDTSSSLSQYLGADISPTSSSTSLHGSINGRRPSSSYAPTIHFVFLFLKN